MKVTQLTRDALALFRAGRKGRLCPVFMSVYELAICSALARKVQRKAQRKAA
jgi:hypothetical protein